jgi:hypothetical protein
MYGAKEGYAYPCLGTNAQGHKLKKRKTHTDDCWNTVSTFINQTTHLIADWPITGNIDFSIDPPHCNAVVLVEWREHPWMEYVLKMHRRYVGPFWMFYLIGPKSLTKLWRFIKSP